MELWYRQLGRCVNNRDLLPGFDEPVIEIGGNQTNAPVAARQFYQSLMNTEFARRRSGETTNHRAAQSLRSEPIRSLQQSERLVETRPSTTGVFLVTIKSFPLNRVGRHMVLAVYMLH